MGMGGESTLFQGLSGMIQYSFFLGGCLPTSTNPIRRCRANVLGSPRPCQWSKLALPMGAAMSQLDMPKEVASKVMRPKK